MRRRNPYVGATRQRVPLSSLSLEQILELSLGDFTEHEWDEELTEQQRQTILDRMTPAERMAAFDRFRALINYAYNWAEHYGEDDVESVLESELPFLAGNSWRDLEFDGELGLAFNEQPTRKGLRPYVIAALEDAAVWDQMPPGDVAGADWVYEPGYVDTSIPSESARELQYALRRVRDADAQEALDTAESLYGVHLFDSPSEIRDWNGGRWGDMPVSFESPLQLGFRIDTDLLQEKLLDDDEVQAILFSRKDFHVTGRPLHDRIVHRFADGGVVVALDSGVELNEEGEALNHCVGEAQNGWPQALAKREVMILSMRPDADMREFSAGKRQMVKIPWFTVAIALTGQGVPFYVSQINGYNNRPLGFPKYKADASDYERAYDQGQFRPAEVERFLELLATTGLTVENVQDEGFLDVSWPYYERYRRERIEGHAPPVEGVVEFLPESIRDWVRGNPRAARQCRGCGFCRPPRPRLR